MKSYNYNIKMNTLLGQKKGTLKLITDGNKIKGSLNILRKQNPFEGTIKEDGECHLDGQIITLVQSIPYSASGFANEKEISLTLQCKKYVFQIVGNT